MVNFYLFYPWSQTVYHYTASKEKQLPYFCFLYNIWNMHKKLSYLFITKQEYAYIKIASQISINMLLSYMCIRCNISISESL